MNETENFGAFDSALLSTNFLSTNFLSTSFLSTNFLSTNFWVIWCRLTLDFGGLDSALVYRYFETLFSAYADFLDNATRWYNLMAQLHADFLWNSVIQLGWQLWSRVTWFGGNFAWREWRHFRYESILETIFKAGWLDLIRPVRQRDPIWAGQLNDTTYAVGSEELIFGLNWIWFRFGMAQPLALLTRQVNTSLCGVAQILVTRHFLL